MEKKEKEKRWRSGVGLGDGRGKDGEEERRWRVKGRGKGSGDRKGERWKRLFWLLFYTIATVFRFYHGSDMMYEMRRRKAGHTLLKESLTSHTIYAWPLMTLYVIHSGEMDCSTCKCYSSDQDSYRCLQGHLPRALTN